jgi:hypothetical protein
VLRIGTKHVPICGPDIAVWFEKKHEKWTLGYKNTHTHKRTPDFVVVFAVELVVIIIVHLSWVPSAT